MKNFFCVCDAVLIILKTFKLFKKVPISLWHPMVSPVLDKAS